MYTLYITCNLQPFEWSVRLIKYHINVSINDIDTVYSYIDIFTDFFKPCSPFIKAGFITPGLENYKG